MSTAIADATVEFSVNTVMPSFNWSKADPNAAGMIPPQTGSATLNVGVPGVAKSSSLLQFAKQTGRDLVLLIGSTHAPEDYSGIPFVEEAGKFFSMKPPKFVERMTRPGCIVALDEINTSGPAIQAASLSMLSERRLGDQVIHEDTWFFGACNPEHMAPNATPLPKSMNNRFWHGEWVHNFETFAVGMVSEDNTWGESHFPVVAPDWKRFRVKYGGLIVSFLRANPSLRISIPKDDDTKAFPTPRSWTYLRDALAGAATLDAPNNIELALCKGFVGDTAAGQFMRHMKIADLIDAEAILDGRDTYKYDKKRPDLAVCLLPSIITAIKRQYSPERMERAVEVFVVGVGSHQRDLVFSQLRHLAKAKPSHESMTQKSMAMIGEFAKSIPAALRTK